MEKNQIPFNSPISNSLIDQSCLLYKTPACVMISILSFILLTNVQNISSSQRLSCLRKFYFSITLNTKKKKNQWCYVPTIQVENVMYLYISQFQAQYLFIYMHVIYILYTCNINKVCIFKTRQPSSCFVINFDHFPKNLSLFSCSSVFSEDFVHCHFL